MGIFHVLTYQSIVFSIVSTPILVRSLGVCSIKQCVITRVVNGGSRSRFTENKTVLSQFTKNKDIMKITVYGELNIYFLFHGK